MLLQAYFEVVRPLHRFITNCISSTVIQSSIILLHCVTAADIESASFALNSPNTCSARGFRPGPEIPTRRRAYSFVFKVASMSEAISIGDLEQRCSIRRYDVLFESKDTYLCGHCGLHENLSPSTSNHRTLRRYHRQ
jgi:hypothetical protein